MINKDDLIVSRLFLSCAFLAAAGATFIIYFLWWPTEDVAKQSIRAMGVDGALFFAWLYLVMSLRFPDLQPMRLFLVVSHFAAFAMLALVVFLTLMTREWMFFPAPFAGVLLLFAIVVWYHRRLLQEERRYPVLPRGEHAF